MTSNSAKRIAELRLQIRSNTGIANRARDSILTLKGKRWNLGSSASDTAKEKRATASIERLQNKMWRAEQNIQSARQEIRSMGGVLR